MFGAGGGTSSYKEVEDTDLLILWGSNARETHPIFFHHVLKAVRNGARLYVIDPRRTGSAQWADTWLGLDVGTDIALSNTMAREIIHAGLTNELFIERATTGFDEYRASVEPWTLEEGERVTGVPAQVIRELAHAYARADRAILCWTLGITEHVTAVDNVLSLINLALLTGHVGRYGSGLNPLRGQNNVQGGGDMGAIPNKLPGFQDVQDDMEARARFEAAWDTKLPPERGWHLSQMFDAMERGEFNTLYVLGENPAQSEADSKRALGLLEGLDFMIAQDILMTKTCEMADVVFPSSASWCESEGGTVTELRAPRAADAQGDRPAGRRARRPVDHLRARAPPRPRLGAADAGAGVGRAALAEPDARRDELRPPGGRGRHPVAVPDRGPSRLAVPARAAVGRARRRAACAALGHAVGAADRRARRRLPDPPDDGPAPGLLQHRRAVGPLQLAAAAWRDARPLVRRRRAARRGARRGRAHHVAPGLDRGAGAARRGPATRASPS